jgi:hypothetical protein
MLKGIKSKWITQGEANKELEKLKKIQDLRKNLKN